MITSITLGGNQITSTQVLLQGFQNASFPSTVYTRTKRGGYQGNKMPTPSFASYQFVMNLLVIGLNFSDLVAQRAALFKVLGLVHSAGAQTLVLTRSDGASLQIDIKTIEVTGDISSDDGCTSALQVTLNAEYPFLQNSIGNVQDVRQANGGGFAIPFGIPFSMNTGGSTLVQLQNNGNYAAYPIFTFVGPLTNPSITNNTTGQTLNLAYTLATLSDSLVVDCYNRSAVIKPSGNVGRQYVSGIFWTVPIGASTVTLSAGGGETGKCTVAFRDTFLGV